MHLIALLVNLVGSFLIGVFSMLTLKVDVISDSENNLLFHSPTLIPCCP